MSYAFAWRLNISFPSFEIHFIISISSIDITRSLISSTLNSDLMPAILSIKTCSSETLKLNVPNARIGIPPGKPWTGRLIAFFVPHFTVNSFVLINSTSARSGVLNPNVKLFSVDKNGIISEETSKFPSSRKIPSILPLYIKIASCPGRIIRRLPFLISLLGNFQKIISSEYSFHSTTLENCPPNNPILVNLPYFCS